MDFTREPIIETVITPKEGFKLVVRSSKNIGQEEYFVDAIEVVSFGNAFFLRSVEKPKAFLVPASDYEVLEVREARIVLKNVGTDRSIKIGGGREGPVKKEPVEHREPAAAEVQVSEAEAVVEGAETPPKAEGRGERKRDRRRHYRRRRGRDEEGREQAPATGAESQTPEEQEIGEDKEGKVIIPAPEVNIEDNPEALKATSSILSSLLTPPPQLISETIERYKSNALFKDAFYERGDEELINMPEVADEETTEEMSSSSSTMSWEFSQDVEAPETSFTDEGFAKPAATDESTNEPLELPPDPQSHRE